MNDVGGLGDARIPSSLGRWGDADRNSHGCTTREHARTKFQRGSAAVSEQGWDPMGSSICKGLLLDILMLGFEFWAFALPCSRVAFKA